jgi:hypothetical protein
MALLRLLDTLSTRPYKTRPLWLAGLLFLAPAAVSAEVVGGVQLPDGARQVGENRYRAPGDLETTLKYYRTVYPPDRFPRRSIVNQPGVKAFHIINPSGKNFEGLNIYEANDEVRIFIVRPKK